MLTYLSTLRLEDISAVRAGYTSIRVSMSGLEAIWATVMCLQQTRIPSWQAASIMRRIVYGLRSPVYLHSGEDGRVVICQGLGGPRLLNLLLSLKLVKGLDDVWQLPAGEAFT